MRHIQTYTDLFEELTRKLLKQVRDLSKLCRRDSLTDED